MVLPAAGPLICVLWIAHAWLGHDSGAGILKVYIINQAEGEK